VDFHFGAVAAIFLVRAHAKVCGTSFNLP
jgi:hypothetical protein